MELSAEASVGLALKEHGIDKMTKLLALTEADLRALTYKFGETEKTLMAADSMELLSAMNYYKSSPDFSSVDEWIKTTSDTFAIWQAHPINKDVAESVTDGTKPTVSFSPKAPTVFDNFSRQIRRNPSDYIAFKKDSEWSSWNRALLATSTAQAVHHSYNLTYVPSEDYKEVFTAIQQYNYSVLVAIVQTPFGKGAVRQFESTFDAQGVYRTLYTHYNTGVFASINAQTLEEEIIGMRLDDKHKKGCEYFLTTWHLKVQELDSIRATMVPDSQKKIWLTSALQTHPQMSSAITTASTMEFTMAGLSTGGVVTLTFAKFFELCLTTAQHLDKISLVAAKRQRDVKNATQTPGGRGGRGEGRGGRNPGRGGGRDGGRGRGTTSTTTDPWWIAPDKWNTMSAEAKAAHLERKKAAKAVKAQARSINAAAQTPAAAAPIPTTVSIDVPPAPASTAPPPGLREMLSNTANRASDDISVNGISYRRVNHQNITYHVQNYQWTNNTTGSLIDGGANGGFAGADCRVIEYTNDKADVSGIGDSLIKNLDIGTVAARIETTSGPIIGIFHQYAIHGEGSTIHSPNQFRAFNLDVNDIPLKSPCGQGRQQILTPEGYIIPLKIRNGLPYMAMSKPSDSELDDYPHVMFTSDMPWDPRVLDDSDDEISTDGIPIDPLVNQYGEVLDRYGHNQVISKHNPDLEGLRPYLGWTPLNRIKRTLEATTQYARADHRLPMRKHFKTRFPAANVARLDEVVATDTFFSDIPAHDDGIPGHGGATMIQLYTGVTSQLTKGYPMGSVSEMPGTLEDFIREVGAPNSLFSDNCKVQCGSKVKNILRMYHISNFQCEPHHQHQNPAERKIQEVKKMVNQVMDRTGMQARFWLLCTLFVICLCNHLACDSLQWQTPLKRAMGQKPDISPFLQFYFGEKVLYAVDNKFPSESPEKPGKWVGVAEHQGDILTYLVLTDDTEQVIARSAVRKFHDPRNPNLRALPSIPTNDGERKPFIQDTADVKGLSVDPSVLMLPKLAPEELLGLTFIKEDSDGQKIRAKVVRKINDDDAANHQKIKFLLEMGDGDVDEIIAYGELSALIEQQREEEVLNPDRAWIYKAIIGHEGPMDANHPKYKGSKYNVLVQWEDGSETYEPLAIIKKDDPVTCATYAKDNGLLDVEGWKSLKRIATRTKLYERMVKQANFKSERHGPIYKFGVQVPRNKAEARKLDAQNGNTKWQDAEKGELTQLAEYNTFKDLGRMKHPPKDGYRFIRVHFVYDCKHDLRRKARMVAGGHMTTAGNDSYSGVVSLRSIRICLLLGELNDLKIGAGDVGNAYLEAYTQEKVYIIAGPEFGELEGHTLVIVKALYGLRTSGARYHEKFAETLRDMGFTPSLADPDVWMRDAGTHWEYLAVYVDDLLAIMKDPDEFFKILTEKYKYKLKGVGPPKYHLGGDFFRDEDGTLGWGASTYIKKLLSNYEIMFGEKPKEYICPLDPKDHPEIDVSAFLDSDGIQRYQSLLGALQWAITLGRFDLLPAVVCLGSFRVAPREGHLDRAKRVCGYLRKHPDGALRFRTDIPDHESRYTKPDVNWIHSVYGDVTEELPHNMPQPKGKPVRTTTNVDANLMHCLITGRSLTGILHFINQCPVEWYSKKQNTVETATFGSEFVAARLATEQLMDLRFTLRMLGAPLDGPGWMFGDNESVVTNSTVPKSVLKKRHNALSYHRVREACAAGVMWFIHTPGKTNVADVLTKYLSWADMKDKLGPVLFWKGDTLESPRPKLRGVTSANSPTGC